MALAYIGIGSNLGNPRDAVGRAFDALGALGIVVARSSLYRTAAWGRRDQPDFINAVAALQVALDPAQLLRQLKAIERRFGRSVDGVRWGPRVLDLDILLFEDRKISLPDLTIPHPRLLERAFALVPLAEIEPRFASARDALSPRELQSVVRFSEGAQNIVAGGPEPEGESVARMSDDQEGVAIVARVRKLTEQFVETDLLRLCIERDGETIEIGRRAQHPDLAPEVPADLGAFVAAPPSKLEAIKADLVGIFRLSRPAASEGDLLEGDRELAYIEALGIRNPVRSLGAGRIVSVKRSDGDAVEYGAVLFEIDRG